MANSEDTQPGALRDPRVYLAVERTYLAWIRTGLALMGFGFVVARFGLLMREIAGTQIALAPSRGISIQFGTGLIGLGVVLTLAAIWRYVNLLKQLKAGAELTKPSPLAITLGCILAILGSVAAVQMLRAA